MRAADLTAPAPHRGRPLRGLSAPCAPQAVLPAVVETIDIASASQFMMVLMHASGPLAHATGCRIHEGYRAWQPFAGG
eukprot:2771083-Prymnesium_polylepis.1